MHVARLVTQTVKNILSTIGKGVQMSRTMADLRAEILEVLTPICYSDPWMLASLLADVLEVACDDDASLEALEAALEALVEQGLVTEEPDAHGANRLALTMALQHTDYLEEKVSYENLKDRVLNEVEKRGLRAKWSPDSGWKVVNARGKIVAIGNMRELEIELFSQ